MAIQFLDHRPPVVARAPGGAHRLGVVRSQPSAASVSTRVVQGLCAATDLAVATSALDALGGGRTGALLTVAVVGATAATGGYAPRLRRRVAAEGGRLAVQLAVGLAVTAPVAALLSSSLTVADVITVAGALVVARSVSHALVRWARLAGVVGRRTIVVGGGTAVADVAALLAAHPECGLKPVGVVTGSEWAGAEIPRVGDADELFDVIARERIAVVVVTPDAGAGAEDAARRAMLDAVRRLGVDVYVAAEGERGLSWSAEDVSGVPFAHLRRSGDSAA